MNMNKQVWTPPRWNSIIFAYASLFLYGLLDNLRGPIFPDLLKNFELSNLVGSYFFSINSLVFMISAGFAPLILKRFGYLFVFRVGLVLIFFSQIIAALAPQFSWFLISAIFMGSGVGVISVMQNIWVLIASPSKELPKIMNGLHAQYAAASLLAPLLVSFIFSQHLGFQFVYWMSAIICLILIVYAFSVSEIMEPEVSKKIQAKDLKTQLWSWEYLGFAILLSSYVAGEVLISSRMTQFMMDVHGLSKSIASLWTSIFFVGLLSGRLFFTFIRFEMPPRKILVRLFAIVLVLQLLGIWMHPAFLVITGLSLGPIYAMTMTLVKEDFPNAMEKVTAIATVVTGIFIITMHSLAGYLTDIYGIQKALVLSTLFFVLCWLLLVLKPKVRS